MARQRPTEDDRLEALERFLTGLAGGSNAVDLAAAISELHPAHDTFPGEVFMGLAADSLELAGAGRDDPIFYEGLLDVRCTCAGLGRVRPSSRASDIERSLAWALDGWWARQPIRIAGSRVGRWPLRRCDSRAPHWGRDAARRSTARAGLRALISGAPDGSPV